MELGEEGNLRELNVRSRENRSAGCCHYKPRIPTCGLKGDAVIFFFFFFENVTKLFLWIDLFVLLPI